jgi:pectate lyase-like protein
VPLSSAERIAIAPSVTVTGRTAAAIQAACTQAADRGIRVLFLPAGQYQFETSVRVPGGLTLVGEGSRTLCRAANMNTEMFFVEGDQVRFTRLKLQGWSTA